MNNKIYFPGLNGVRFIAVFIVILDHVELFKSYFNLKPFWPPSFSSHMGSLGVTIFFVLSGYLITYLLLTEKKESGVINIKNFYIRRVLRIWPLYFILLFLGFFVLPNIDFFIVPVNQSVEIDFWKKFGLFFFLMANVAFVFYPVVAFAGVLWSVAVEEQFYLFWPHVIKKSKNILLALIVCLFIYMIIKMALLFNLFEINSHLPARSYSFINRTRFSAMIIGAIGAFFIFTKNKRTINILLNIITQIVSFVFILLLFFDVIKFPYFDLIKNEFTSLIVAVLIINISTNEKSLIKLENRYFNFLGKISYGMYIYHSIFAVICVKIFSIYNHSTGWTYYLGSILVVVCTFLLTVLTSHLSYKFIEEKILKKKVMFSTIQSGDLVRKQ